jgi:hypothetical protein
MTEEFQNKKIYKNQAPSSIIDYIGNNITRNKTLPIKRNLLNYSMKRNSYYKSSKYEIKDNPPITSLLKPVQEKILNNEESSSYENNEENNSSESSKKDFKLFKSENINYNYINQGKNNTIYNSTNQLYNFQPNNNYQSNFYKNIYSSKDVNMKMNINSPYISDKFPLQEISNSFKISNYDKGEFFLNNNQDSDDTSEEEKIKLNISKEQKYHKIKKDIKKKLYLSVSVLYFSLYLLCLKIILQLSLPEIPSLGVSSFIINFNNLFISILFMKLDQVNIMEYLNFDKIGNYFIKIIINYIKILLTIRSLYHIKLFSFILILNMSPLLISFFSIRSNYNLYTYSDFIHYFMFIFIIICEFLVHNNISTLCVITIMLIDTMITFTKITSVKKTIHPYIIDFGSSLIGIAISPIIMSINADSFLISFSQYILFTIICFAYFLNHYFELKYACYSLNQGYQIVMNVIVAFLYIIYSHFLLKENNHIYSYAFLCLSFIIHIYGKLRLDEVSNV